MTDPTEDEFAQTAITEDLPMRDPTEDEVVQTAITTVLHGLRERGVGPDDPFARAALTLAHFAQDTLEACRLVNAEIASLTENDDYEFVHGFWRRRATAAPVVHEQLVKAFHQSAILDNPSGELAARPTYGEAEAMAEVANAFVARALSAVQLLPNAPVHEVPYEMPSILGDEPAEEPVESKEPVEEPVESGTE